MATKLMIVAHPDDELLWGYAFFKKDPENWKIVSVTNGNNNIRKSSFNAVMKKLKIKEHDIWSFKDTDDLNYQIPKRLVSKLTTLINQPHWTHIVTHNTKGEYGHVQHKTLGHIVPDIIKSLHKKVKFGKFSFTSKIPNKNIQLKYNIMNTLYQNQQVIFAGNMANTLHCMLQHASVKYNK